MAYRAPVEDLSFFLKTCTALPNLMEQGLVDLSFDLVDSILEEGGKFAASVIEPLDRVADKDGCKVSDGAVTTPSGWRAAYEAWCEAGWSAVSAEEEFGGQHLPSTIASALSEMFNSACPAFALGGVLTAGAVEALTAHGAPELQKTYLEKMVAGTWTGTMNLTEPQAGSDLAALRAKAVKADDGTYRIFGTKIFISYGEHDIAENIVHLVLARLPDAPKGSKGISLFVVPKFKVKPDGSLGERNPIYCTALEHKMGIHGNATCALSLDGAVGTLVGEPNKGLAAMFVMMNTARLGVGNQSLGLTEVAFQNALAYAKDRIQMRSLSGKKAKDKEADPIIFHPDVRKMLLTARAYADGARALQVFCSVLVDKAHHHPDEKVRKDSDALVALLTPIVKAFVTDNGFAATNACMQVFGGHGYIKEWGMEQFVRDARINMIYEGTNTVQSLDLLGRKVLGDQGAVLKKFGKLVGQLVQEEGVNEAMAEFINPIAILGDQLPKFTTEIGFKGFQNPDEVGAAAVDYLRVAGHLVFGYLFARMAQVALRKIAEGSQDPFYTAKLQTARFYFAKLFPEIHSLMRTARAGGRTLMETDAVLA